MNNAISDYGKIIISEEVVATIAGITAIEIDGVVGMSGGFVGGLREILGRKNLSKGVKAEVGERETNIDLFIIVKYGSKIPDICEDMQEKVKKEVESMTGLEVREININVEGVSTEKDGSNEEDKY